MYLAYDEAMIREAIDNLETGISIGGHIINTIRYADDKALAANSQKGLQQLMDNLNKVTREFSMKINVKKMKVMCISQKGNNKLKICVDGQQVSHFRYLDSLISEDRFDSAQKIFVAELRWQRNYLWRKKLFTGKMNLELKKRIMKCLIWSVALYAAETWTLTQTDRTKIRSI